MVSYPGFPSKAKSNVVVNLSVLPIIVIGYLLVILALAKFPWPADFVDAQVYNTASHWNRLTSNDLPAGYDKDTERPQGYTNRRVFDGLVYAAVVIGALSVLVLGIVNQAWGYLPMAGAGIYGLIYAATVGLTAGPLVLATGFALVTVGSLFGWLSSGELDDTQSEFTEGIG